MNNKEAIEILNELKAVGFIQRLQSNQEALDLAIKALEVVDIAMKLRVKVGDVTYEDD